MNGIKTTVLFQLYSPATRKSLVLSLYRSLLKALSQQSAISSDIFLKSHLKTRISMKFMQFKQLRSFPHIFKQYWKGVEFLDLLKNCENEENAAILTEMAYGPLRFKLALALNYACIHEIKREKAEKLIESEIKDRKLAYNYAVPKELLDYMNENPRKFKRLCEPKLKSF